MTKLDDLKQGAFIVGDHGLPTDQIPEWLDRDKFYRARNVFRKYFFSILFAHLSGLITTIHLPFLLPPLLITGQSASILTIFRRYLNTLIHTKTWYEGDIWNPEDPAHKSIVLVRKMHIKVAEKINGRKNQTHLSFSQYEMALTQYAFIGLMLLYPHKIGMSCSSEDLDYLVHFWRGVGYQLGIHDHFNICSNGFDEAKKTCQEILEKVVKPHLSQPEVECRLMSMKIVKAMNMFIVFLNWEAITKFWFESMNVPMNFTLDSYQLFCYWLMKVHFQLMFYSSIFRSSFNNILMLALRVTLNGRKKIEDYIARYFNPVTV